MPDWPLSLLYQSIIRAGWNCVRVLHLKRRKHVIHFRKNLNPFQRAVWLSGKVSYHKGWGDSPVRGSRLHRELPWGWPRGHQAPLSIMRAGLDLSFTAFQQCLYHYLAHIRSSKQCLLNLQTLVLTLRAAKRGVWSSTTTTQAQESLGPSGGQG